MSLELQFTCDICGKKRGEGNGWLLFFAPESGGLLFQRWTLPQAQAVDAHHVCGGTCANTALDRWKSNLPREHTQ